MITNRFNNKDVEVWRKGTPINIGGGVMAPGEPELTYVDKVNIQPYSSAEAKKDYGLDVITTHAMFSDVRPINIGSNFVRYDGKDYEVKEKIVWEHYMEVLLEAL